MVPRSLRTWFQIHFIVDMIVGLPLLFAPVFMLEIFSMNAGPAFAYRVIGAAFMGIGWESLLGRNGGIEQFRGMLRLKLIWSSTAALGMSWGILNGEAPPVAWLFVAIFAVFFLVWAYYARRLAF